MLPSLHRHAQIAALGAALIVADQDERAAIAGRLLELARGRRRAGALLHLGRCWPLLSGETRSAALLGGAEEWGGITLTLAPDPDPRARASAAALAEDAPSARGIEAVASLLRDPDPAVRAAVARACAELSGRVAAGPHLPGVGDAVRRFVADAVLTFDAHREPAALLSLARLAATPAGLRAAGPELIAWFADEAHPAHTAVRTLLRRSDGDGVRAAAWQWLPHEAFRTACAERLTGPATAEELEPVLRATHLLANPLRRAALARSARSIGVAKMAALFPAADSIPELPAAARRGLPRMITPSRVPSGAADRIAAALLSDPDPAVRHALLRECADGSTAALDLCFDGHPRVAGSAALLASRWSATAARPGALAPLRRSPHPRVRGFVDHLLPRRSCAFTRDPDAAHLVELRALAKSDRDAAIGVLRRALRSADRDRTVAAVAAAHRCGLLVPLELDLLAVLQRCLNAGGADLHAAAAIAATLADLSSPTTATALLRTAEHPDGRVRASAIEAMARRERRAGRPMIAGTAAGEAVARAAGDEHHRVRAAAVRARVVSESGRRSPGSPFGARAEASLAEMLGDPRPMHRVAALFVVDRIASSGRGAGWAAGGTVLAGRIADLAASDPSDEVRAWARLARGTIVGHVRNGWTTRALGLAVEPGGAP